MPGRFLLLLSLAIGLSACGPPLPPRWRPSGLVNGEDGAVVVWQRAEFRGGGFNGFDRNPITIARATYRAAHVREVGDAVRFAALPVPHVYEADQGGLSEPHFRVSGGRLVVDACNGVLTGEVAPETCPGQGEQRPAIVQLGWRGEPLTLDDAGIVVGASQCRVAVPQGALALAAKLADYDMPILAVAHFPGRQWVYLAVNEPGQLQVWVSRQCGPFEQVDVPSNASVFGAAQGRDLKVIDVAPTPDPVRPALLLDWMQRGEHVYEEHAGVLHLSSGRLVEVSPLDQPPIGFWQSSPTRLLLDYKTADGDTGTVRLTVLDVSNGRRRPIDVPLPRE